MMPAMLALIVVLALTTRSIALVIGAAASVEKASVDGRIKAVSCSPVAFPCHFPARHLAGKIFSLLARLGKLAQRLDLTGKYPAERADFGAETKNFPAFSRVAGKFAPWARMRPIRRSRPLRRRFCQAQRSQPGIPARDRPQHLPGRGGGRGAALRQDGVAWRRPRVHAYDPAPLPPRVLPPLVTGG